MIVGIITVYDIFPLQPLAFVLAEVSEGRTVVAEGTVAASVVTAAVVSCAFSFINPFGILTVY